MKNLKIELKWALIFTIAGLLWMTLERILGLHDENIENHAMLTSLFAIPAITVFVLALLDKRNNFYGGYMTWKQGFVTGLLISVIVAALSPLSQIITAYVISPDFYANAKELAVRTGKMTAKQAEDYFNLSSYMVQAIFGALIMGLITSAVIAFFVKKKRPDNEYVN